MPTIHSYAPPRTRSDGFLWTTTSATPAAAAATAARAAITPGAAAIHAAATPSTYRGKTTSVQAAIFGDGLPRYSSSSPHPRFDTTLMKVNVAATFGQKTSPVWAYFTKLHRRFRPRDEPGQGRHATWVAETARSVVCTPTTVPRL